jgi:hypothetical protein
MRRTADAVGIVRPRMNPILAALVVGFCVPVQEPRVAPEAPVEHSRDVGNDDVVQLLADLAKVRGVAEVAAVERVVLDDREFLVALDGQIDANLDDGYFDRLGQAFVRIGMLQPEEVGVLRDAMLGAMATTHLALYDPWTKRIVARETLDDPTSRLVGAEFVQRAVLAHEVAHALQDQRFGLAPLLGPEVVTWDRRMANAALVEGDAVAMAAEWTAGLPEESYVASDVDIGADTRANIEMSLIVQSVGGGGILDATTMVYSYASGAAFVQSLVRTGGWSAVDAAFAAPPLSAEQVLHPTKYTTARDWPVTIEPALPQSVQDAGWTVRSRDTFGELFVQVVVKPKEGERAALEASIGWDGDRFLVCERGEEGAREIGGVWVSVWDSELDAQQAAQRLGECLRFGRERAGEVRRSRKRTFGHVTLRREGTRVVITSGFEEEHFEALERAAFDAVLHTHADDTERGANDAAESRRIETEALHRLDGMSGIVDGRRVHFTDVDLVVELPSDAWVRSAAPQGVRALFARGAPTTNFNVAVVSSGGVTLETMRANTQREIESIFPDAEFTLLEIGEVNGVRCVMTRYTCTLQGKPLYGQQRIYAIGSQQVVLTCTSVGGTPDQDVLDEFEALLGSATFGD